MLAEICLLECNTLNPPLLLFVNLLNRQECKLFQIISPNNVSFRLSLSDFSFRARHILKVRSRLWLRKLASNIRDFAFFVFERTKHQPRRNLRGYLVLQRLQQSGT